MTSRKVPVLIVGAGPVGLALAGDLGWRGVQCCLVEKTDGAIYQPRMDMVGVRTMEFCRRWGIAGWVENSPYPRDYPQDNVWLESLTGFEFGRERMASKSEEPCPPQSPQKRERCPQDMFDPILRRFAGQFSAVEFRYRTELIDLEEGGTSVVATLRDLDTGREDKVVADYLVGTDGAASIVREKLGIPMRGEPVLTYTTNVIFRCRDLPSLHDKGKAYRFIFIGREGTWLTIVAIDGADRWRMSIIGDKSKREIPESEIRALIVRAMGKPFDFEIESIMPWVRRELMAETYGTDRVFLAGAVLLAGACISFAQSTSHAKTSEMGTQKRESVVVPSEILYGAAYYHEYMPYDRLDKDVALMKEAGISVVRMGESTWSLWEPQDGHFEYAWMDRVVDAMGKAGGVITGDNSNTQFALLALWNARRHGVPVECPILQCYQRFVSSQNRDGGFPSQPGEDSNAQSTAWAVQGLLAAGRLAGFEVNERFYEVGSPAGIEETERFILGQERPAERTPPDP